MRWKLARAEAESTPPASWPDAFKRLHAQINDNELTVVLLDEISWLAYYVDDFAEDLKIAWDNLLKKHDKLIPYCLWGNREPGNEMQVWFREK